MASKLADWLRQRREELELSRPQVAVRTRGYVSASHLSKVEMGQRAPSAQILTTLAPIYGVDPIWLLKFAGIVPSTVKAPEPAPAAAPLTTWEQVQRAIAGDHDLSAEDQAELDVALRRIVKPILDEAATRKRRERRAG